MLGNIFKVLISVKAKLFFGFLAMTLIILALGGYALVSTGNAGQVVKTTFDKPLMAINYARSAGQVFAELEIELLNTQSKPQHAAESNVQELLERFKEDLDVAKTRSIAPRAARFFAQIETDLLLWESQILASNRSAVRTDVQTLNAIEIRIRENLDVIIELQTNESFRARETAIAEMEQIKDFTLYALLSALAVTLLLSIWVAVTIINPLKAAADAARKISAGNFNVDIPPGGDDETGVLLKTLSAMQTNIRSRMGQEQNLRALAQHRLSDSLKNSKDAILLTDHNGLIIVANPQISRMFPALSGVDLLQRPYLDYFDSAGRPLNDRCVFDPENHDIEFADGRWARVNASATQEGGQLFIWTDITEAKDRAQKLMDARDAAQAADKAKTLFLAAMSHELRTPLNAVIGFSDILENYNRSESGNADHAELAGLISQSGAHLLNIVKDVLSIASGDSHDEMYLEMAQVNLVDVMNFCVKTIASEAQHKNIRLMWDTTQNGLSLQGDKLRLQQVVLNLLSNAIKYNNDGGAVKLHVNYHKEHHIRIDVIDNGIGIAPQDIERITQPFVQVDDGYTRKYDGVGLGLSLVKQIVTGHEGQMHIRSALGKGTAVTLILPKRLTKVQLVGTKTRA